jgi:hypothetical protein
MDLAIIERLHLTHVLWMYEDPATGVRIQPAICHPRHQNALLLLTRVKDSATRTASTQLAALELSRNILFKGNGNLHQSNQITISLT